MSLNKENSNRNCIRKIEMEFEFKGIQMDLNKEKSDRDLNIRVQMEFG